MIFYYNHSVALVVDFCLSHACYLHQKDVRSILGDRNAKVGSQEIPGVTGKFVLGVQHEAGQRLARALPRKCTGHSKHSLPTTQETTLHMDITKWLTPKSD